MFADESTPGWHLIVVITSPFNGEVVTAAITTRTPKSDTMVVLEPKDHPFIKHQSVVAFHYSAIRRVADVEQAVSSGDASPRQDVETKLVTRIREACIESDFTSHEVRFFLREWEKRQDQDSM